jgi:hypothetical protein
MEAKATKRGEPLPEFDPGRQAGWIFQDGEAVSIERQDEEAQPGEVDG